MEKLFYKKLVNRIYGYKMVASHAEFDELKNEVTAYSETLKEYPVAKAHQLFYEKYGELVKSAKTQEEIELLKQINKTLGFFKVVAVIAIILTISAMLLTMLQ